MIPATQPRFSPNAMIGPMSHNRNRMEAQEEMSPPGVTGLSQFTGVYRRVMPPSASGYRNYAGPSGGTPPCMPPCKRGCGPQVETGNFLDVALMTFIVLANSAPSDDI